MIEEMTRTDRVALGMLIFSHGLSLRLLPRANKCAYILEAVGRLSEGRTDLAKDLMTEFLLRKGIEVDDKHRITDPDSLLKFVNLLEPWSDFIKKDYPYEAVRYLCLHPPSYDNVDAFREYVAHVDSIL